MSAAQLDIPLHPSSPTGSEAMVRALQAALRTTILRAEKAEKNAANAERKLSQFVEDLENFRRSNPPLLQQGQEQAQERQAQAAKTGAQEKHAVRGPNTMGGAFA